MKYAILLTSCNDRIGANEFDCNTFYLLPFVYTLQAVKNETERGNTNVVLLLLALLLSLLSNLLVFVLFLCRFVIFCVSYFKFAYQCCRICLSFISFNVYLGTSSCLHYLSQTQEGSSQSKWDELLICQYTFLSKRNEIYRDRQSAFTVIVDFCKYKLRVRIKNK